MRPRAETPHTPARMPWLVEIGQQLRAEYTHTLNWLILCRKSWPHGLNSLKQAQRLLNLQLSG
jgi:hypothetical protein